MIKPKIIAALSTLTLIGGAAVAAVVVQPSKPASSPAPTQQVQTSAPSVQSSPAPTPTPAPSTTPSTPTTTTDPAPDPTPAPKVVPPVNVTPGVDASKDPYYDPYGATQCVRYTAQGAVAYYYRCTPPPQAAPIPDPTPADPTIAPPGSAGGR